MTLPKLNVSRAFIYYQAIVGTLVAIMAAGLGGVIVLLQQRRPTTSVHVPTELSFDGYASYTADFIFEVEEHKEPGPWVLHFDPEQCGMAEPGTLVCHRPLPKGCSR